MQTYSPIFAYSCRAAPSLPRGLTFNESISLLAMRLIGFGGKWLPDGESYPLRRLSPDTSEAASRPNLRMGDDAGGWLAADHTARREDVLLGLWGSPAWIGASDAPSMDTDPAGAVLGGYLAQGTDFLKRLDGPFALAILDARAPKIVLAVDRMGIGRLTYAVVPDGLVFSSSAAETAAAAGAERRLRPQALYDYLLLHIVPAPETVFHGVGKLRAGTCLTFDLRTAEVSRYWVPAFNEDGSVRFEDLRDELRHSLLEAVRRCRPDRKTGAFLSGGLDSSTVAGMLGRAAGAPARTFSMGFGVDAYDELAYARIANRHFGCTGFELHVTPEHIVDAIPRIAAAYDEPFGNSSAVPTYVCARSAAEQGVDHMLAGDGGDELFGGNERYVRQRVFELYGRVPRVLRRHLIEPLSRLVDEESSITPLRKLRSYVAQAAIPMPERLETWNLIYRTGPVRLLDPDFLSMVDPRRALDNMREVYDSVPGASLVNRMLFYDWQFTLSDNDLRKVGTMCELAGVKVSYPMLDARVVDLSLRVPSNMKIKGTELRWFYKSAMQGFLPDEILHKTKHGFGLPFGEWLKTHKPLNDLVMGHLESLRNRRIVSAAFIDEVRSRHLQGDASFYGYPIWDMAMLDAWMEHHGVTL